MDEYAQLYREELEDMLKVIKDELDGGMNPSNITRAFHTVKSSSRVMGFTRVSEICERMEEYSGKLKTVTGQDKEVIKKAVSDIESLS